MRVLLITDFYPPYRGGVEHHVHTLATGLTTRGHRVTVATLGSPSDDEVTDSGVRIRRIEATVSRMRGMHSSRDRPWAPPLPDPGLAKALRQIINDEKPHVVHGHDWLTRSALPVLGATPLVTTLHYYTQSCAKKNLLRSGVACDGPGLAKCLRCTSEHYGPLKGPVVLAGSAAGACWERRRSQHTISVSRACATGNRLDSRQVSVVSNPVPVGARADEVPGLPAAPFILYAGDMRAEKGVDVLVDAHRQLQPRLPLVLMGGGEVPGGATDDVIALGERPHSEVVAAMAAADFVVVPSIWADPNPLVVLEALDNGTPVVAAATGGITDVVVHETNGLLVERGNADALASACQRLLDSPELLERLAAGTRDSIAKFDIEHQIGLIEAIYADLVRPTEPR